MKFTSFSLFCACFLFAVGSVVSQPQYYSQPAVVPASFQSLRSRSLAPQASEFELDSAESAEEALPSLADVKVWISKLPAFKVPSPFPLSSETFKAKSAEAMTKLQQIRDNLHRCMLAPMSDECHGYVIDGAVDLSPQRLKAEFHAEMQLLSDRIQMGYECIQQDDPNPFDELCAKFIRETWAKKRKDEEDEGELTERTEAAEHRNHFNTIEDPNTATPWQRLQLDIKVALSMANEK